MSIVVMVMSENICIVHCKNHSKISEMFVYIITFMLLGLPILSWHSGIPEIVC